jgi:hypothetical protein
LVIFREISLACAAYVSIYMLEIPHMIKITVKSKGKAVPLQAWSGPEGSRKLRFPDFTTTAQDGGKVVSLTHQNYCYNDQMLHN